jgi:hypothetical protein
MMLSLVRPGLWIRTNQVVETDLDRINSFIPHFPGLGLAEPVNLSLLPIINI